MEDSRDFTKTGSPAGGQSSTAGSGQLEHCLVAKLTGTWSVSRKFVPSVTIKAMPPETGRQVAVALYVVAMVAVIVGVDFAFFRNRFWERLIANIGIVSVFAAFYLRFFRRP